MSATNLEVAWTRTVDAIASGSVAACIPAKTFMAEVRALPSEVRDVELRFTEGSVSVNGWCEIRTAEPEEFPVIPSTFGQMVKVGGLTEALSRVIPAVSTDETRYALTGVMVDLGRGKVAATDGFRLHYDAIVTDDGPALILPAKAVKILLKFKGEDLIHLPKEGRHVGFSVAGGHLTARLMEGAFPDYEGVIPDPEVKATFASSEFLTLIEGAKPLTEGIVRLTINGALTVSSSTEEGSYQWRIPCETEGIETELTYAFNHKFLIDAIKAYPSERIALGLPLSYGACLVNGKAVVMPVRC